MHCPLSVIHLFKELKELCRVHLNGWLDAVNSNEGGRGSRDLQYCLGRQVGGLWGWGWQVSTCKNVLWRSVRDHVNGVTCVDLVVNNICFTYKLCILCGWYSFCGDGVPWWSLIPNTGRWYVESHGDCHGGTLYLSVWGLVNMIPSTIGVLTGTIYVDVACAEQFITLFLVALFVLTWRVLNGYVTVIMLFLMDFSCV